MTEEEVSRLWDDADETEAAMEKLIKERLSEEAAFKKQLADAKVTGERYDALLTAHFQQWADLKVEYNAADEELQAKKRKAELAEQLLAAEQVTRVKQAKEDATEEQLRSDIRAREEAVMEEEKIRALFFAAS